MLLEGQAGLRAGLTANIVGSPHDGQMTTYREFSFVVPFCGLASSGLSSAPQQKHPTLQASTIEA